MPNKIDDSDLQALRNISDHAHDRIGKLQEVTAGAGGAMAFFGTGMVLNYVVNWGPHTAREVGFWEAVAGMILGCYLYYKSLTV